LNILLLSLFYYFGKTVSNFGHFWQNFLPPGNSDIMLKGQGGGCGGGAKSTEGVFTIYPVYTLKNQKDPQMMIIVKILRSP
jgi:hypothetical protein